MLKRPPLFGVCGDFLFNYVFSFVNCFDSKDSLEDSYYSEREWRVAGNVQFSLGDVSRVFFPQECAARFRADVPAHVGQISFLDLGHGTSPAYAGCGCLC
jgi:hypothetical protein